MTSEEIIKLAEAISWPLVVIIIFFASRKTFLDSLSQYAHVEFAASAIKVTLKRLEDEYNVPKLKLKSCKVLLDMIFGH